jgi:glucan biosynthesis protein C
MGRAGEEERLFFIDNIRILLIVLVILVHLAITYGAPVGDWYYKGRDYESQAGMFGSIFYVIFLGVTQSFFMGFFFMISGYFTPGSYDKKGARLFFKDRLVRLGIPLIFYIIFFDSLIKYSLELTNGFTGSFLDFLGSNIRNNSGLGSGPLWFVETLLIFSGVYVLWCLMVKSTDQVRKIPENMTITIFALILGIVTFIVRIWLPLGWNFRLLNLQIPFFPQYIAMFIIGLIAYRGNWFLQISQTMGKLWSRITVIGILFLPILFFSGAPGGDPSVFFGGFNWQAFAYALWEQILCVAIIITLLAFFREKYNDQGTFLKSMSKSVYTVYIIHAPVLVFLALSLRGVILDPLINFVLVAPLAIGLCFLLGNSIRKLPIARNIL